MPSQPSNPIGIFDSGIGGLTVAHAINVALPHERLIYFGDTAHLPYGDKSMAAVQAYSIKIADLLLQRGCKVIVIACNTASAVATELLKEYVASRSAVINVIDPMVERITQGDNGKKIGVIGTKGTISSGIYRQKLQATIPEMQVGELATPLLVPMIEEGFIHNRISKDIIDKYLSEPELEGITDLILGCTHYPLIREDISKHYQDTVRVHDSSVETAKFLADFLAEKDLLSPERPKIRNHFFVSDYTKDFEDSANHFFGKDVNLEEYKLWE